MLCYNKITKRLIASAVLSHFCYLKNRKIQWCVCHLTLHCFYNSATSRLIGDLTLFNLHFETVTQTADMKLLAYLTISFSE